ncbi:hypothetical protein PGB90_000887 [Kerria lacca]
MFRLHLPTKLKKSKTKNENNSRTSPAVSTVVSAVKTDPNVDFKPFTRESAEKFDNKTMQIARECGYTSKRKSNIEDEFVLPEKFEPFPRNLYGRPLEEIDNFIYEEVSEKLQ